MLLPALLSAWALGCLVIGLLARRRWQCSWWETACLASPAWPILLLFAAYLAPVFYLLIKLDDWVDVLDGRGDK